MTPDLNRRNRRLSACLLATAAGMVGLAYASAPLYDLFCRVTGFGGTTQVAAAAPGPASARLITVRFNADTHPGLPWGFRPTEPALSVRLGEQGLTAYRAENRGAVTTVGTATFNVTPDKMGKYFNKVACFCFEEQALAPGGTADFPVAFFVDPAMADDPATADVRTVTLSYTFFRAKDEAAVLAGMQ